jgi:signal transduction histidine kinase
MENALNSEQTILLVSDDAVLCAAARREFESKEAGFHIAAVSSVEAAHRAVEDLVPAIILLEETSLTLPKPPAAGEDQRIETIIASLAAHARVIVIGSPHHEAALAPLVAAGSAYFVTRSSRCLPIALELAEHRLRQIKRQPGGPAVPVAAIPENDSQEFGQVLRHEMNNPLTGILGNAELLLAEVRRKNDGRLPNGGQQRLETIASLAVRLRETVLRLSQDWEARHHPAQ